MDKMHSTGNELLRQLHAERADRQRRWEQAQREEEPDPEPEVDQQSAALSTSSSGTRSWSGAEVSVSRWHVCCVRQPACGDAGSDAQGCVHGRGACLACCDAQPVAVQWHILSQLEAIFAVGAMPRPSAAEARASGLPLRSLVAGEITWPGIFGMLQFADASPADSFLDCGAGHGRAVAAFALGVGGRSYGVEIRPSLAQTAQQCLAQLKQDLQGDVHADCVNATAMPSVDADVSLGDIFAPELDWCAYDIVLVNATGFDNSLMLRCSRKLTEPHGQEKAGLTQEQKRRRKRVLVLSQPLPPPCPAPVAQRTFKMSWGQCSVFLHRI